MGKAYCLAGAVAERGTYRIVRPVWAKGRQKTDPMAGWSAFLLDGHTRSEVFELVGPYTGPAVPPHVEDLWVRNLKPHRRLASAAERREILSATRSRPGEPLFGEPLSSTLTAAYLRPGTGRRSLATVVVPSAGLAFSGHWRGTEAEPDIRVQLPLGEFADRRLPVKDHHLLRMVEQAGADLRGRIRLLHQAIRRMGPSVAVRLGLSRPYAPRPDCGAGYCWLMADGFYSFSDPQP
jgi:hypothetical protein